MYFVLLPHHPNPRHAGSDPSKPHFFFSFLFLCPNCSRHQNKGGRVPTGIRVSLKRDEREDKNDERGGEGGGVSVCLFLWAEVGCLRRDNLHGMFLMMLRKTWGDTYSTVLRTCISSECDMGVMCSTKRDPLYVSREGIE